MFFKKENSKNTETREELHHLMNNIYKKKNTTVNIILKDKELEFYPQISGKKARLFSLITAFQNLTANPRYCSKTRKRNKRYTRLERKRKKKKLFFFNCMIIYVEYKKKLTKRLLKLISDNRKFAGYNINIKGQEMGQATYSGLPW